MCLQGSSSDGGRTSSASDRPYPSGIRNVIARSLLGVILILVMLFLLIGCTGRGLKEQASPIMFVDEEHDLFELALRFAPRLYVTPVEPYAIMDIVVLFHPDRPLISYHIFWEDDVLSPGWAAESDREIVWVAYDVVSLKLTDVWTSWHRRILQTSMGVIEAKEHGQRPKVFVQWGKHGLLPAGWDVLKTARPKAEMYAHFMISKAPPLRVGSSAGDSTLIFSGDYADYLDFSVFIDSRKHIRREAVYRGINSNLILKRAVRYSFWRKLQWPKDEETPE